MAGHLRAPSWLDGDLGFSDAPLLEAAYAISDWTLTLVGPIFWICLVYLFLVAEFGR